MDRDDDDRKEVGATVPAERSERETAARPTPRIIEKHEGPPRGGGGVHIAPNRDWVRWRVTRYLIWWLGGVILLSFVTMATTRWTKLEVDDVRAVFEVMFTALVGLVGSAVGFYFGSERRP